MTGPLPADAWFKAVVESAVDVIQVIDRFGITQYISPAAEEILGVPTSEILGRSFQAMVDEADRPRLDEAFTRLRDGRSGDVVEVEFRVRRLSGEVRWIQARAASHIDTPGVGAIVASWRDVTLAQQLQAELQHAATHDAITGLPTRAVLLDHLELALADAARPGSLQVGVLFCDLDRFKLVNDTWGHAAGDEVLRSVAQRLREVVRPGDTVARLGGDEFAVVCTNVSDGLEAARVAQRIISAVPGRLRDRMGPGTSLGISVGVSVSGARPIGAAAMLDEADAAMYEAKRRGGNRLEFYDERLRAEVSRRLRLEAELQEALHDGQFTLLYQPVLDLRSDAVVDAAVRLRWRHPSRGVLRCEEFLSVAEQSELVLDIGDWKRRAALAQAAAWAARGGRTGIRVAVSPRELGDDAFPSRVEAALAHVDLPPHALTLELPERAIALAPPSSLVGVLALRQSGVRLAVDGFGAGLSSLTVLTEVPVDEVELHPSLTDGVLHDHQAQVLDALVQLHRALGLTTTAAGVSDPGVLDALRRLGCDRAVGDAVGPPAEAGPRGPQRRPPGHH